MLAGSLRLYQRAVQYVPPRHPAPASSEPGHQARRESDDGLDCEDGRNCLAGIEDHQDHAG